MFPMFFAAAEGVNIGNELNKLAGDLMGQISSIMPAALSVTAAVMGIHFGMKLFKKITGARS